MENKKKQVIQFWLTTDGDNKRYIHPSMYKPYRSHDGNNWFNRSGWYILLTDAFLDSFKDIEQEWKDDPYLLEVTVKKLKAEPQLGVPLRSK